MRKIIRTGVLALLIFGLSLPVHAVLNSVGPVDPGNGFPVWYQDAVGRALQLCLSSAVGPNGPMCILLPDPGFDPASPTVFPTNFPRESFWFIADATLSNAAGNRIGIYRAAMEAAFANDVVRRNDQISFARIRIRIDIPAPGGTYTVTHPYGTEVFNNVAPGVRAINFTADVGIGSPGVFTGALNGAIGPFLNRIGGPITVGAEQFIGDPNILEPLTGSPSGNNFVRVEGPNIGGPGVNVVQTDLFNLAGKIFGGALPTPLMMDRATYTRTAGQGTIDVFAYSSPTAVVNAQSGTQTFPMVQAGTTGKFYTQIPFSSAALPLGTITVSATSPPNTKTVIGGNLVDVVKITQADFDSRIGAVGGLAVTASSSDDQASLTTAGLGILAAGSSIYDVAVPSDSISVVSSAGGQDQEPVNVVSFTASAVHTPSITSTPTGTSVSPGQTFTYLVSAIDPDALITTDLAFSIDTPTPAPGNMTIQKTGLQTATFRWTPTANDVGARTVTLRVTDPEGLSAIQNFTITVSANEQLRVTQAQFRTGTREWRISGTTNVPLGNNITIHLGSATGPVLVSNVPVTGLGAWTFREAASRIAPGNFTSITAVSAFGTTVSFPLNIRN